MNISDEIKRLHELHQAGALTDLEFEQAKNKLLQSNVNLDKPASGASAGATGGHSVADDFVSEVGRLRRSRSDRMIGGVCGGIARVSGIESWIWRLVFVLCTVFAGFGLLFYVLMWIFVPEE